MATKFNLSAICKQAWFYARCAARGRKCPVRECLSDGFKSAWAQAKGAYTGRGHGHQAPAITADAATRKQLSFIASLSGRSAPSGLTKKAASAMIDNLLVSNRLDRDSRYEQYDDNCHLSMAGAVVD